MLIGQRNNHLFPKRIKWIDGMQLLDGPLGRCFAGVIRSSSSSPAVCMSLTAAANTFSYDFEQTEASHSTGLATVDTLKQLKT